MKRLVWTAIVTGFVALVGADALAQSTPQAPRREQLRARIEKRVEQRFKRLDQNSDGLIEQAEWSRRPRVFQRFDANHDGALDRAEFQRLARAVIARRLAGRRR